MIFFVQLRAVVKSSSLPLFQKILRKVIEDNNQSNMYQIQIKGIRTLELLREHPCTLDGLADKLCVCRRYAQQVIKYLKDRGCTVRTRTEGRTKYFWVAPDVSLFPAVLTLREQLALEKAMVMPNDPLQSAIYKMLELSNVRLHIYAQR